MTENSNPRQELNVDDILGICATYGTSVLGTKDQVHFIEGFKSSNTYREAKALLADLIQQRIAEQAEQKFEDKYTTKKCPGCNRGTFCNNAEDSTNCTECDGTGYEDSIWDIRCRVCKGRGCVKTRRANEEIS